MSQVVNVKVSHIRPKYNNLADWMSDPSNVYIGRAGIVFIDGARFPKQGSIWANPFKVKDSSREEALEKYEIWIRQALDDSPMLKEELMLLDGKKLGCWCYPDLCHGTVLVKIINELKRIQASKH